MEWRLVRLETVDSTNEECKRRAALGEPEGLAVIAGEQTRGKGRLGRAFQSLAGKGLYLSVLLRPRTCLEESSRLTAWTAVSVARALERAAGLRTDIKWPNDVQAAGKKLCGILTEAVGDAVIVGVGVNLSQTEADWGEALSSIAVSLAQLGVQTNRAALETALLEELGRMYRDFPAERAAYLAEYRRRCITRGPVRLLGPEGPRDAVADGVEEDFSLRVTLPDGTVKRVTSGEVSVRPA